MKKHILRILTLAVGIALLVLLAHTVQSQSLSSFLMAIPTGAAFATLANRW